MESDLPTFLEVCELCGKLGAEIFEACPPPPHWIGWLLDFGGGSFGLVSFALFCLFFSLGCLSQFLNQAMNTVIR